MFFLFLGWVYVQSPELETAAFGEPSGRTCILILRWSQTCTSVQDLHRQRGGGLGAPIPWVNGPDILGRTWGFSADWSTSAKRFAAWSEMFHGVLLVSDGTPPCVRPRHATGGSSLFWQLC